MKGDRKKETGRRARKTGKGRLWERDGGGVSEKEEGSRKSQGGGRDLLTCFGMYVCVRALVYTRVHVCVCEGQRVTHF